MYKLFSKIYSVQENFYSWLDNQGSLGELVKVVVIATFYLCFLWCIGSTFEGVPWSLAFFVGHIGVVLLYSQVIPTKDEEHKEFQGAVTLFMLFLSLIGAFFG